ncbi:MAG: aldo/keto reductase, partial [Planctomycetota bacterium]
MNRSDMNRRFFLKAGAMGILGLGAAAKGGGAKARPQEDPDLDFEMEEAEAPSIQKYNILGSTGLKVSDISLGMAREDSVFQYALDRGINFFDTAESYYQGRHEYDVGRALKPVRDKVIVTTKHYYSDPARITRGKVIKRFDDSLKRLGFDYVDIAMWHEVSNPALFQCEELLGAYEELKKAGKLRFLGFSTHNAETICPPAFEAGVFSAMMVIYNSVQYPERSENIKKAKELGIGVIAMKTMMGQDQDNLVELADDRHTYSQAAIKWALTDECVPNVVISMRTYEHIDEYLKASGGKLTQEDKAILKKYVKAVDNRYCRIGCRSCLAACPNQVAIHDIMRFGMYYENYGEKKRAMLDYARMNEKHRATPCVTCDGKCMGACPHNLAIQER